MSECAPDVWTLKEKEVAMFTKLLVLPPRHVQGHGWPSTKWLEKQEFKIENGFEGEGGGWYRLTKRLERDLSTIQQVRVILAETTGFQRDKVLPPRVDVCWVHRSLSPFVVHEVFECVAEEVTFKTDRVRSYRGARRTADLCEFVDRMTGINSLWLGKDEFDKTFCKHGEGGFGTEAFPDVNRVPPLLNAIPRRVRDKHGRRDRSKPRVRRSCEGCVLAFIGGRGSMLSDLRAHLLARSRVDKKSPRLLSFVEAWMQHFGGTRAKQLRIESEDLSVLIEGVLREESEQRRDQQRKEARKSKGRVSQRNTRNSQRVGEVEDMGMAGLETAGSGMPQPQVRPRRRGEKRVSGTSTVGPRRNRESRNEFADQYSQESDDYHARYLPARPIASDPYVGGYAAEQEERYGVDSGYSHGNENSSCSDDDYDGQYTQLGVNSSTIPCQPEEHDDCDEDADRHYVGPRSHWRQPNKQEEEQAAADEEIEHDESWDVQTRLREWSSRRQLRPETVLSSDGIKLASNTNSDSEATSAHYKGVYEPSSNRTMTNLSAIVPPLKLRDTVVVVAAAAAAAAPAAPEDDHGYESDSWQSASVMTWVGSSHEQTCMDVPPVPRIPSKYRERHHSRSQNSITRNSFYQLHSASSIYSREDMTSSASSVTVYTGVKQTISANLPVALKDPFAEDQRSSGRAMSFVSEVSVRTPVPPRTSNH